ncbi:hypothetical protein K2173_019719 [Erythroxylum novogranatense]|uniref:DNA annealing helicase and endonuclease ZRANB3 n=1 Tax=Erythroxylum novogranatense TaxID=1862640 RepID=A0AAV8SMR2_9ROSI|nr:hypothetical protein K2173_019719 [Erythroxylum novogranatense]
MPITEEQRQRAEANRLAALAKRKVFSESIINQQRQQQKQNPWRLFKCRKLRSDLTPSTHDPRSPPLISDGPDSGTQFVEKFLVRLEICSPDSFSVTPKALQGFSCPGVEECLKRLADCLSTVMPSHYTQNHGGGKACVYKLRDYDAVLNSLKNYKGVEIEKIPFGTLNVIQRLSHSFDIGRWAPCRPAHLTDEEVDELIAKLPRKLLDALLPFQVDGLRFGLQRGGRCLIADEMGLGKTLQAIAIAGCYIDEGPILVVCPAVLRFSWAEELERWLSSCLPSEIHLVFGHRDNPEYLSRYPRVVVISYKMLHHLQKSILVREWALLIVDESHHVRCSKKKSDAGEVKAVLDVAEKIKHIVLLSGTPSLSRPYDIFHQINMLWQDFSRGSRLEELNILLRQTVMIRRLKEHVMEQLPPKRRQIIRLLLKKSDIVSAKAAVGVYNGDNNTDEAKQLEKLEETCENEALCKSRKISYQELGIAKLSGFYEWLSIHPLISEPDRLTEFDVVSRPQKMLIFAHHHKVLDRVQEFICEKKVGFVRIDGTTLARDRQIAVQSFQSSNEVKIAIIGVTAGGVGLDFSLAQNVVFLELPQSPSLMLQAEDRAHRRGQINPVNVYIFCAKDTLDERIWQRLNKSLHCVSSITNGKYDALSEISVENVSYLGVSDKYEESRGQALEMASHSKLSAEELHILPVTGSTDDIQPSPIHDEEKQSHTQTSVNIGSCEQNEAEGHCSKQLNFLRFEVSQYTGRIHLYSCIPGVNLRPQPLFENFQPEELELLCSHTGNDTKEAVYTIFKGNPDFRLALLTFVSEWDKLRPIEKRKLRGKTLQLPLSIELRYLNESMNHNAEGMLNGGSKRRTTPLYNISHPLPENAVWKLVNLRGGFGKKEKQYTQGWTLMNEPLCKLCQKAIMSGNAKTPEYFEDLFCGLSCYEEYRSRTSSAFLRKELFQIEHGICSICQLDCHQLVKTIKPLSLERRTEYIEKVAPKVASRKKLLDKLANDPSEANAWHADHIIPVYRGGGECKLENMRTLCVACHYDVTAAQCAERRITRAKARKQLKTTIRGLTCREDTAENAIALKGEEDITEEELLVKVPGSSYSGREDIGAGIEDLKASKVEE